MKEFPVKCHACAVTSPLIIADEIIVKIESTKALDIYHYDQMKDICLCKDHWKSLMMENIESAIVVCYEKDTIYERLMGDGDG
jgi:hypothetical protein